MDEIRPGKNIIQSDEVVRQYDKYALMYEKWTQLPLRKYALTETVLRNLPDLTGKRALDLACGTGISAQLLRGKGAQDITGVDSSSRQLAIFRAKIPDAQAVKANLLEYDLASLGAFDVITAIYLFEYFPRISDVDRMIKNIKSAMRPDSFFLGLTIDQAAVASQKDYYGIQGDLPQREGQEFVDNLPDGEGNTFPVTMYYWTMDTLRRAFIQNDLRFEELPVFVSEEGIRQHGRAYWDLYFRHPIYRIFRADLT